MRAWKTINVDCAESTRLGVSTQRDRALLHIVSPGLNRVIIFYFKLKERLMQKYSEIDNDYLKLEIYQKERLGRSVQNDGVLFRLFHALLHI